MSISLARQLNVFFLCVAMFLAGCSKDKSTDDPRAWLLDPNEVRSRAQKNAERRKKRAAHLAFGAARRTLKISK